MPPLDPQIVEVRLGKLDSKTSDKLCVAGALTTAQNAEIVASGRYQRRPGTAFYETLIGATRLHAGERELLAGTDDVLYSDIDGAFDARGAIAGLKSDFAPINNSSFEQLSHDFVRYGGFDWHVWSETTGIYYCVRDSVTGAYLVVDGVIVSGATFASPRIIGAGTNVMVAYQNTVGATVTLVGRKITLADPTTVGAAVTIEAAWNNVVSGSYDMVLRSGDTVAIAYVTKPSTDHVLRLKEWNISTMAVVATLDGASMATTSTRTEYCLSFVQNPAATQHEVVLSMNNVGVLPPFIRRITAAWGLSGSQTVVALYTVNAGQTHWNITGTVDSTGTLHVLVGVILSSASTRTQLWYFSRTSGGVITGPSIRYGFRLMSNIFSFGGRDLALVTSGVSLAGGLEDRTYFLIEVTSGSLVGRALPSLGTDATATRGILPRAVVEADQVLLPSQYFFTTVREGAALVTFKMAVPARWLEVAGTTLIPGSTIHLYDGVGTSELGFHHPPSITVAGQAGTTLAAGTYYYRCCWVWVDAQGRTHRSDPCEAISVVIAGAVHGFVTVATLNATLKSAPVQQAAVEVYRTTVNPSAAGAAAFYLVTTVANNPANDTITIADSLTDLLLAANERLYTLGNSVLSNTAPPPANMLASWGNRVWAAERDVLWYSKELQDGFGVAFPAENFIQISDDRGDITAIADGGPKFVVFKRNGIYTVAGDGPTDTGQGSFSPTRRLPVPLGARSAVAVISTEIGVFFQDDASGQIWIVPPESDPAWIGREVAALAPELTITDAVVVPDRRQVRFFSAEGTTLVYDLAHQLWTWFTGQLAAAAAVVDDVCGHVTTAGEIRFDDIDVYTEGWLSAADPGETYQMALETAWIVCNQIAGFARCYAAQAVGVELGEHRLGITMGYRFGAVEETRVLDTTLLDSTYGFRVEARPALRHQRATAIRLRFEDDSPETAGFALEVISLTVGLRPARERLPKAHIATS